jgi:hypothetical protein
MRGRKLRIGETSVRLYARHTKPVPKKRTTAAQLGAEYRENRKYHRSLHTSPDDAWLDQCYWEQLGRVLRQFKLNFLPVETSMSK